MRTRPEILRVIGYQLFVGTVDALQSFMLTTTLNHSETVSLSSSLGIVEICTIRDHRDRESCRNHIQTIELLYLVGSDDPMLLVCGTNSYEPRCTLHQWHQLSSFTKFSAQGVIDEGYSSYDDTARLPFTSLLTSSGKFYSHTAFSKNDRKLILRMSPGTLQRNTDFTLSSYLTDPRWLSNTATFVSGMEYGEYVYFFFREIPIEEGSNEDLQYSRVARICIHDTGARRLLKLENMFLFRTFEKTRMECGVVGFDYNYLSSVFVDNSTGGAPVLYGAFNSAPNGPKTAAICRYTFDKSDLNGLTGIFGGDFQPYRSGDPRPQFIVFGNTSYACPGSPGRQRSDIEAELFFFRAKNLLPIERRPLFQFSGEFLGKIVAETLRYGGDIQEVIYYSNQRGDIKQVVRSCINSGEKYEHTIYSPMAPKPVTRLILNTKGDFISLIASTNDSIINIPRGLCHSYTTCHSCFESRDAHCGWDISERTCLTKNTSAPNLVESFTAGRAAINVLCNSSGVTNLATYSSTEVPGLSKPLQLLSAGLVLSFVLVTVNVIILLVFAWWIWMSSHRRVKSPTARLYSRELSPSNIFQTGTSQTETDTSQTQMDTSQTKMDTSQVGISHPQTNISLEDISQTNIPQTNIPQAKISQADTSQADIPQTNIPQANISQMDTSQADTSQADTNIPQTDISQMNVPQANISQADTSQVDTNIPQISQTNVPQVNTSQMDTSQLDIPQPNISQTQSSQSSGSTSESYKSALSTSLDSFSLSLPE